MKKTITIIGALAISSSAFATNTSNIDIKANIIAGCTLTAVDLTFGDLAGHSIVPPVLDPNVNIQCSKNTAIKIGARSERNPIGYNGFFMGVGSDMVPQNTLDKDLTVFLPYNLWTRNVQSTTDYTVTRLPLNNALVDIHHGLHSLFLTVKSQNKFKIPLTAEMRILTTGGASTNMNTKDLMKLAPGNYTDNLTYVLDF